MKLKDLKEQLKKYIYIEDPDVVDVVLASTIATRLQIGNPVWMVVIGAPSAGKTQYINPLEHAQPAGQKFIHRITDLTSNTFLSGYKTKDYDPSLLHHIGEKPATLLFPDLTSLFSKDQAELREILGQFRTVYEGYLLKHTGNGPPLTWEGYLGVIAASTPSIYKHFEEYADMGERFLYYRMKPYDRDKALETASTRKLFGKALDAKIGELYGEYLQHVLGNVSQIPTPRAEDAEALKEMAKIASVIRTQVHVDKYSGLVDRIPESEMPMRTMLQLRSLAMGMMVMNTVEYGSAYLTDENHRALEWCAFSLASDERRSTLKTLTKYPQGTTAAAVGGDMRLPSKTASHYLEELHALELVSKYQQNHRADVWTMQDEKIMDATKRAFNIEQVEGEHIEEYAF